MAQNTKLISSGGSDQTMDSTLTVGATVSAKNQHYFPSSASLNSSVWSSSGGSNSEGDSYAWSASLSSGSDSDSDYDSSDCSSSFSGDDSTGDEESDDKGSGQAQPQGGSRPKLMPMPPTGPPPPPMEGLDLSAIAYLKSELMKVGQTIIQSNVGQERAERAQILASINWLSSHVPNAVLDHLGHEIRQMLEEEKGGVKDDGSTNKDELATSVVNSDDMTDVSDLSVAYLNEMGYEHEADADLAEVANMTATGYGDLANFAHAKASAFLPDMDIEPEETDAPQNSAIRTMSLDDILQGSEDPLVPAFGKQQSKRAEDPLGHSSRSSGRPTRKEDPLVRSSHRRQSLNRSQKGSADPLGNNTTHTSRSYQSFGRTSHSAEKRGSGAKRRDSAIGGHPGGGERRGSNEGRAEKRGSMLGGPLAGPQDSNDRRPPISTESGGGLHESGEEERHPRARGVKGLFKRFVLRSKSDTAYLRPSNANEPPVAISRKKKSPVALQANPSLDFIRMPTASYHKTKPEAFLPGVEIRPESRNENNPAESDLSQSLYGSSIDESDEKSLATSSGSKDQDGKSKDKLKGANLPQSELYLCALLFVDISGFTKLSTLLDPESLSRVSCWTKISSRGCLEVSNLPFIYFRQSILTFSLLLTKLWRGRVIY